MRTIPVIECLDVVEYPCAGFFSRGKPTVMNQFILEVAEEALDDGIVVAIAFAAHADQGADLMQLGLIIDADIG